MTDRIIDIKPKLIIVDENFEQKRTKKNTDDELLNLLKGFYQENGRIPTLREFVNNPRYPGFSTYQKRFGSWNNALMLTGMDIDKKVNMRNKVYTDIELLNYLKDFCQKNGRIPVAYDFANNPTYPCLDTYQKRFGSWNNALKQVGMDLDSMVKKGDLKTTNQKGRWFEIIIRDMFKNKSIDLSGDNRNSLIDGICPNGQTYDVKTAKLRKYGWDFATQNKDKEEDKEAIQWYYFGAFNEDYTELLYVWRVPGEIVDARWFHIGTYGGRFNV